ncbi:amidohydrolase family protein [Neomoorella humiferrea]|uniref:amidohydrolase family protein n=1 Tax=Neomoorella humiferrea TaxID=676965 RepID=UPI003D949EB1
MIIDFRIRPTTVFTGVPIYDPNFSKHSISIGAEPIESVKQNSLELLIQEMKEAGITKGVIMGRQAGVKSGSVPNEKIAEVVQKYPDYFIAFAGVNPLNINAALKEITKAINELGFKGVSVDPGFADEPLKADDRRLYPIYAKCEELGVPVSITTSIFVGPDVSYSMPASIHRVANDFPDLQIIVPHAAWPWVNEILGVAFITNNVWLSPDLYINIPNMPGATHFVEAANYYLGDRMLFASAYPIRSLKQSVSDFMRLPIKEDVKEKILYKNAIRLLRLE